VHRTLSQKASRITGEKSRVEGGSKVSADFTANKNERRLRHQGEPIFNHGAGCTPLTLSHCCTESRPKIV
jgi:hypothetical protein